MLPLRDSLRAFGLHPAGNELLTCAKASPVKPAFGLHPAGIELLTCAKASSVNPLGAIACCRLRRGLASSIYPLGQRRVSPSPQSRGSSMPHARWLHKQPVLGFPPAQTTCDGIILGIADCLPSNDLGCNIASDLTPRVTVDHGEDMFSRPLRKSLQPLAPSN